ncbi:hypothetical protein J8J14_18140 [Roseomonas sp. SSH11]|uniref:Twin-arginine translocation pathway signal n=1 Tax=Pararoseomonas baculiformis TaxID=2820812 RepID=A0ABS4AI56_9PROT|nr:hypothetical protein [Pararoseomonas baculiformis]MBP0446700.1 hypothetical protein [Pararoseomonas baculiformis]
MIRRTTRSRRAVLNGACAATLVMMAAPAAGAAKAAELDGELIALLAEARRQWREWQPTPLGPNATLADLTTRPPWHALVIQAASMPARSPEGMRAKAEAVRWWVLGDHQTTCDRFHTPQEWLAASLVDDLLGSACT